MNFKQYLRTGLMVAVIGLLSVAFRFDRPMVVGDHVANLVWLAVFAALAGCVVGVFGRNRSGRSGSGRNIRLVISGILMLALASVAFLQPLSIAANAFYAGGLLVLFVCAKLSAQIDANSEVKTLRFGHANLDDDPEWELYRELHRARHFNRPLSMAVLSPATMPADSPSSTRMSESRAIEFDIEAIGDSLAEQIKSCDILMFREGMFVLLLPETEPVLAERVTTRLATVAKWKHGMALKTGIAGFPHEEVTLVGQNRHFLAGKFDHRIDAWPGF